MSTPQMILLGFQIFLAFCNTCIMVYVFVKFLNKPHDSLADEVKKLKEELVRLNVTIERMQKSLDLSHEKHREQDKTNKVFKRVFLLLANFEVAYCQETGFKHTDDLKAAKKELEEYLTSD